MPARGRLRESHAGRPSRDHVDLAHDRDGTWYQSDWFLDLRSNIKLSGACLYDDRYLKVDGTWKILHTGYERLYEIVEQLASPPVVTAHYLGKHARPPHS
ncbi:MAG TPA: hypothetical protein VGA44_10135 [Steroidobacteraceae bacterium]